MLFVYPAIFHRDENAYWAEFPDLEGCQTYGDDISDTVANAQEALSGYILTLMEDETELKKPSDIQSIAAPADGFVSLVTCDVNPYKETKAVKKTLSIPAWINERATAMGLNFSQVLQDALLKKIMGGNRIPFELSADPFYSRENMAELEKRVSDIRTGKSVLKPHEL